MLENTNLLLGILVLALILLSAFFSLAEIALTTCSRAKIHRLEKDGDKRAMRVEKLLQNGGLSNVCLKINSKLGGTNFVINKENDKT